MTNILDPFLYSSFNNCGRMQVVQKNSKQLLEKCDFLISFFFSSKFLPEAARRGGDLGFISILDEFLSPVSSLILDDPITDVH